VRSSLYILCLLFFFGKSDFLFAQKQMEGIVFDGDTKQRIAKVRIINVNSGDEVYNNSKGEFSIQVKKGDVLIAASKGFHADTVTIDERPVLLFYLKRATIYLEEVSVMGRKTPEQILEQERENFNKAYRLADPGDVFSVGPTGAGVSINAIYSLFSREVKNAKRLTRIIENDYKENIIDYKFTETLVSKITGLQNEYLKDFMIQYRPSYYFVISASEYQMTAYIRSSYVQFTSNPALKRLPLLPEIKLDIEPYR
jgi:co-chaperonin GroES (HSP10)